MHRDIVTYRYWNTNGVAVAIVAVEGRVQDVAAYIGGDLDPDASEEATLQRVRQLGAKLTKEEAYRFLPQLELCGLVYRD